MMPLLFAIVIGFNHAFEADHVLAVGNIAHKRPKLWHALRDGIYWGLGHTSTIFLIGCIFILGKYALDVTSFEAFEVLVGICMIGLGGFRLYQVMKADRQQHVEGHKRHLAYSVGLIHGLAGSGAVVLIAMTNITSSIESIVYLLLFGLGSIAGMMLVAGLFNLPFYDKVKSGKWFQTGFGVFSALLCVGYGIWMIAQYLA